MTSAPVLIVTCVCGWEAMGYEEEVIKATQDHGRLIHNMETTKEQVLAMAKTSEPTE
ncbi:MAG: hypothetical protein ACT4OP_03315 [Actinomycetota bacterium]